MTTVVSPPVNSSDPWSRDATVAQLRELAAHERLRHRAAQLRRLADDLEAEHDLPRWAEVGLYDAFLRDDTVAPPRKSALRAFFDLMPGILIFLPIGITWFGLAVSTQAYRESRGDAALAGKSFLEQWQTGFNGRLAEGLYFDQIALWTLFAIGLLLTVSLAQAMVRWRTDRAAEQERVLLLGRLATALTAVDFRLSEFRMNDAAHLRLGAQELSQAAEQIREAADLARVSQAKANEGLEKVREGLDRLREVIDEARQDGTLMQDAVQRVGDVVADIGGELRGVTTAVGTVTTAAQELTRSATASGDQLRDAVQRFFTDATARLQDSVVKSREELSADIGRTGDAIREALDAWRMNGAIYTHRNEVAADQLGIIVSSLEELLRAVERLPESVDRMNRQSTVTAQRLEQIVTEAVERLRRELDRFMAGLPRTRSVGGGRFIRVRSWLGGSSSRSHDAGGESP